MSSYRPRYDELLYDDVPPPPPPPDLPPLPRGPPPAYNAYRYGDSWRPVSPRRQDFSFRNRESAPQYPRMQDFSRSQPVNDAQNGTRRRNYQNDNANLNRNQRNRYGRGGRVPRPATCNRPLLKRQHRENETDLEMLGVAEGAAKYLNADDLDETSEAEMDESDSDREEGEVASIGLDGHVDIENNERPMKRRDIGEVNKDAANQPKWSNPDPYSVLPPVDETLSKRKDPVETIRKYRKATESKPLEVNQVAANDDFISFDMNDGSPIEQDTSVSEDESEGESRVGVSGAPTGPRLLRPSQQNGHRQASKGSQNTRNAFDLPQLAPGSTTNDAFPNHRGNDTTSRPRSPLLPDRIVLDTEDGVLINGFGFDDPINVTAGFDDSLGNRKRTHDDKIKGRARGATSRRIAEIGLLEDWRPDHRTNPIPWLKRPEYLTINGGFRLHKEICEFFDYVRPQRFEEIIREDLIKRLRSTVKKIHTNCDVHCFGSFAAGLYLPNADMDVVVTSKSYRKGGEKVLCQSNRQLRKFGDSIKMSGLAKDGFVEVITGAKVPLVKFVDDDTSIRIDMSFENDSGLVAIDTFHTWKRQYPAMPVLLTVVKQFLMMRGLNEVQHGGIGGFTVTCLVTSLLQNMPRVQTGKMVPEEHLGEVLIEFLDFYGSKFDVSRTGISMDPPEYFDKHAYNRARSNNPVYKPSQSDRLAILDPNNSDHDISGGSRNVLSIFGHFAKAHRQILTAMKAKDRPSLLDWMLGGNYQTFIWQRNHLRNLYNERYAGNNGLLPSEVGPTTDIKSFAIRSIAVSRRDPPDNFPAINQELASLGELRPSKKDIARQKGADRVELLRKPYPSLSNIPTEVTMEPRDPQIQVHGETKGVEIQVSSTAAHDDTMTSISQRGPPTGANQGFSPSNSTISLHTSSSRGPPSNVANNRGTAGSSRSEPILID